ncbi:sodium channel subunit beta-4 isoform X1 [Anolis carolinensis]|uniref:sodium channel subunit beta-4 isoform X1 n=1 Tax=Anolis carolinensis TaxID=28377 RepID=UPI002F2B4FE2
MAGVCLWLATAWTGLQLCSLALGLEVSVGKVPVIYTRNGTDVLLPCTFTSCIGIEKANFSWYRNHTELIFKGVVKNKDSKPEPYPEFREWFKYMMPPDIALSKDNREFNISLILLDADFSDSGKYTCHVKNPKEKNAMHNDTITLKVVVERDGESGQDPHHHHRLRCGRRHRPPHPHHGGEEAHPLHPQEDAGQEGVPGELLGQRQHGERSGRIQRGTEDSQQGLRPQTRVAPTEVHPSPQEALGTLRLWAEVRRDTGAASKGLSGVAPEGTLDWSTVPGAASQIRLLARGLRPFGGRAGGGCGWVGMRSGGSWAGLEPGAGTAGKGYQNRGAGGPAGSHSVWGSSTLFPANLRSQRPLLLLLTKDVYGMAEERPMGRRKEGSPRSCSWAPEFGCKGQAQPPPPPQHHPLAQVEGPGVGLLFFSLDA